MTTKLKDLASTIRSKNGGIDHITFAIIFLTAPLMNGCVTAV